MPVSHVLAFSAEQVSRLTGLSNRQLRYWDDTEFFTPAFREDVRHSPWARVYSFRDVVGLRALAQMRRSFRVPLQHLRKVGAELRAHYDEPWATLTLYVVGRSVFFQDEGAAIKRADQTRQQLMPIALARVEREIRDEINRLQQRGQGDIGRVARHRYVAENRPVLAGTRIPTEAVWQFHAEGYTPDEILAVYPHLTMKDVQAALRFETKKRKRAS